MKIPVSKEIKNSITEQLDLFARGHDGSIRVVVKDRAITTLDITNFISDDKQMKAYQDRMRVSKKELEEIGGK